MHFENKFFEQSTLFNNVCRPKTGTSKKGGWKFSKKGSEVIFCYLLFFFKLPNIFFLTSAWKIVGKLFLEMNLLQVGWL